MRKTPTLFLRNEDNRNLITQQYNPEALWLLNDRGAVATRKIDGTACLYRGGTLWKRYDAKKGRVPPKDFIAADKPDETTGHWPGWVPCDRSNSADRYHFEALDTYRPHPSSLAVCEPIDWTYELIGPKVQGNPEGYDQHALVAHGSTILDGVPLDYDGLRIWFEKHAIEGVVWWSDIDDLDCQKVKIKRRDFGLPWPITPY